MKQRILTSSTQYIFLAKLTELKEVADIFDLSQVKNKTNAFL